jgi:hypothetical protein
VYKEGYKLRAYLSILGWLVRKHWPGFVTMPNGRTEIAWTWDHYAYAPHPEGKYGRTLRNCGFRVIFDFWIS